MNEEKPSNHLSIISHLLDHDFSNPLLLQTALCHASYLHEHPEFAAEDNERLEFLGDAVLDLVVSQMLMECLPEAKEGELSKIRASLVSEVSLSKISMEMGIGEFLMLGKGEELGGGRQKASILADAFEAIIGAFYLDAGLAKVMNFLKRVYGPFMKELTSEGASSDFKSMLQELTQQTYKVLPKYILLEESGPPHARVFRVGISLKGITLAEGVGRSKKEAEQEAAREAYICLTRS